MLQTPGLVVSNIHRVNNITLVVNDKLLPIYVALWYGISLLIFISKGLPILFCQSIYCTGL